MIIIHQKFFDVNSIYLCDKDEAIAISLSNLDWGWCGNNNRKFVIMFQAKLSELSATNTITSDGVIHVDTPRFSRINGNGVTIRTDETDAIPIEFDFQNIRVKECVAIGDKFTAVVEVCDDGREILGDIRMINKSDSTRV